MVKLKSLVPARRALDFLRTHPTGLMAALAVPVLLFTFFNLFTEGYHHATIFNGYPANGAFQLLNPLRRLEAGQIAGVDFQFFHGIGVLFVHYPLYALLGKTLLAAELSRWLISPVLFFLSVYVSTRAVTGRSAFSFAVATGMLAFAGQSDSLAPLIAPFNSILGVRSTMPFLVIAAAIWLWRTKRPFWLKEWKLLRVREATLALLSAVAVLMGTEHGLAIFMALAGALALFDQTTPNWRRRFMRAALFGVMFALSLVSVFSVATLGHPLGALEYALVHLPRDQFWYFGAPPNNFLRSPADLWHAPWLIVLLAVSVLVLVVAIREHRRVRNAVTFGLVVAIAYGILSNVSLLGYYHKGNVGPFWRVVILVGLWLFFEYGPRLYHEILRHLRAPWVPRFAAWLPLLLVVGTFWYFMARVAPEARAQWGRIEGKRLRSSLNQGVLLSDEWRDVYREVVKATDGVRAFTAHPQTNKTYKAGINRYQPRILVSKTMLWADELKPGMKIYTATSEYEIVEVLPKDTRWLIIVLDKQPLAGEAGHPRPLYLGHRPGEQKPSVWSLYTGFYEAENQIFNPSGSDYIIHALGSKQRAAYVRAFDQTRPEFVLTLRRKFFPYEEWLHNEHWSFYERLALNYRPATSTLHGIVWERIPGQAWKLPGKDWQELPLVNGRAQLPASTGNRLYSVEVKYEPRNPYKLLPFIGSMPRYLVNKADGSGAIPVSLPPYRDNFSFPMVADTAHPRPALSGDAATYLPGQELKLTRVRYREVPIKPETLRYLLDR